MAKFITLTGLLHSGPLSLALMTPGPGNRQLEYPFSTRSGEIVPNSQSQPYLPCLLLPLGKHGEGSDPQCSLPLFLNLPLSCVGFGI